MTTQTTETLTETAGKLPASFFYGYDYETLKTAFDKVADPADWRGPILAEMPGECVNLVVAAIKFFTATAPEVWLDTARMVYTVSSVGYRAGPAGDH